MVDPKQALVSAAVHNGMAIDEATKTFDSGFTAGARNPAALPNFNVPPVVNHARTNGHDANGHHAPAHSAPSEATTPDSRVAFLVERFNAQTRDAHAIASTPLPPIRDRMAGLLPMEGIAIVSGLPGTLKSAIAMDMCGAISAGSPWLSSAPGASEQSILFPLSTEQTRTLWLNADMNNRDLDERIAAVCRRWKLQPGQFTALSLPEPALRFDDSAQAEAIAQIATDGGYGVVAIDNLSVTAGKATLIDETIVAVMRNLRTLSNRGECLVLVVAHEGKSVAGRDALARLFGSVQIPGLIELSLSLTRLPGSDIIKVETGKVRRSVIAGSWHARFSYDTDPNGDLEGFTFFWTSDTEAALVVAKEKAKSESIASEAFTWLRRNGDASLVTIQMALPDRDKGSVRTAVQGLCNSKRITSYRADPDKPTSKKNPLIYSASQPGGDANA